MTLSNINLEAVADQDRRGVVDFVKLTSKCFFRFDVEVFDVESRLTLGRHRLHWTMIFFP